MNKIKLIICVLVICSTEVYAQIGVNTDNPQTLFHVDASGNNATIGVPTIAQNKDDFFINIDNIGQANAAIGVLPASDRRAQLELGANNKGFMTNGVKLAGTNDLATVLSPMDGMFVYNTSYGGTVSDPVVPGLYYFEGGKWHLVLTSALGATMTLRDLQTDITTTLDLNSTTQAGAPDMDFGSVDLYEPGSYAFAFRLYGPTGNDTTENARGIFYIWLYVNGVLADFAELNTPVFINKQPISYSVILGASVNVGDVITFKFTKYGDSTDDFSKKNWTLKAAPGQNVAKTTMLYWKL